MKKYEIITKDYGLVEYQNTFLIEAENESEAQQEVLKGNVSTIETESIDYHQIDIQCAKEIITGEFKLFEVVSTKEINIEGETNNKLNLQIEKLKAEIIKLENKLK